MVSPLREFFFFFFVKSGICYVYSNFLPTSWLIKHIFSRENKTVQKKKEKQNQSHWPMQIGCPSQSCCVCVILCTTSWSSSIKIYDKRAAMSARPTHFLKHFLMIHKRKRFFVVVVTCRVQCRWRWLCFPVKICFFFRFRSFFFLECDRRRGEKKRREKSPLHFRVILFNPLLCFSSWNKYIYFFQVSLCFVFGLILQRLE